MEAIRFASFNVNGINRPNKRRIIFDKIRKSNAHIAFIQETHSSEATAKTWATEWGGKALFNHGLPGSRGVAILFSRNFTPKLINERRDAHGRILVIDVEVDEEIYTIASLYAPTQDKPIQQADFMDNLELIMDSMASENVVIGGDLNCILDPGLDRNSTSELPSASLVYRNRLRSFMEDRSLCDVMRVRYPTKRSYTFRRGNYASRLDLFIVSDRISEMISQLKSWEGPHSDHLLISCQLRYAPVRVGQGYWRFDTSLLSDDKFIKTMSSFLSEWTPPPELSNPNTRWEWLKLEIGNLIRKFVKEKRARDKQFQKELQSELESLCGQIDRGISVQPEQLESVRREIKELDNEKANLAMLRSRATWARLGEKPSSYFLNLERRTSKNKVLSTVVLDGGGTTSDPNLLLKHCRQFYQNLYHEDPETLTSIEEIEHEIPYLDLPSLTDEETASLDSPFTQEELKTALDNLNVNKCPGTDGLPPRVLFQILGSPG